LPNSVYNRYANTSFFLPGDVFWVSIATYYWQSIMIYLNFYIFAKIIEWITFQKSSYNCQEFLFTNDEYFSWKVFRFYSKKTFIILLLEGFLVELHLFIVLVCVLNCKLKSLLVHIKIYFLQQYLFDILLKSDYINNWCYVANSPW
jgi:hypothetical protein